MSRVVIEAFGALGEALEAAAAAAKKLEAAYANAGAKSASAPADAVAGGTGGPKGAKKPAPAPVAGKPAKGGKVKAPEITYEDVQAKLTELMESKGKQAVKDLLSEFGIAKLKDLEEDNYSDMHAKAVELLNADESEGEPEDEDEDMFGA